MAVIVKVVVIFGLKCPTHEWAYSGGVGEWRPRGRAHERHR